MHTPNFPHKRRGGEGAHDLKDPLGINERKPLMPRGAFVQVGRFQSLHQPHMDLATCRVRRHPVLGGAHRRVESSQASELLLQSVEGQVAFAAYLRLRKAKGMLKYVPAVVMGKLGFH